jgi:putative hemolysin
MPAIRERKRAFAGQCRVYVLQPTSSRFSEAALSSWCGEFCMNLIFLEIFLIIVLIMMNGLFSLSELAIVSSRKIRLGRLAQRGSGGAKAAIELAENPRKFLSTVQIGITLVGILAGTLAGATLVDALGRQIADIPVIGVYGETLAFLAVVSVITYSSIVFGELIPKSIALNAPERVAEIVARPMRVVSNVAAPVVWMLTTPTSFLLRMLGVHANVEPPVTDQEIKDLLEIGTKAGVFEETEQEIIASVIAFEEQRVTVLMTPRTKIAWIDVEWPPEQIRRQFAEAKFSRLPIARNNLDSILGYATAKGALRHLLTTGALDLSAITRTPLYVPASLTVLELLEKFRDSDTHLAVVVDEHGGVEGIVTLHDMMRGFIGELSNNPHAMGAGKIQRRDDGSLLLDGRLTIFEFKEEMDIEAMPNEGRSGYETVAGFVLEMLGRLPKVGDTFRWSNYEFRVQSMERNRVGTISVSKVDNSNEAERIH